MPRIRSLVVAVKIDVVQRAHDCQGNANHRLSKGDRRLAVRKDRGWDHYCMECGKRILERDAAKIAALLHASENGGVVEVEED